MRLRKPSAAVWSRASRLRTAWASTLAGTSHAKPTLVVTVAARDVDARPQWPLWASTGTTEPACSDVLTERVGGFRAGDSALGPVVPSALDQRVVEHRVVVVLVGDHDELVPDARVDDAFVVDLGSEAFGVDRGEGVTGAIHPPPAVAATDDGDELACVLVVVGGDELDERLLWRSATEEGDDVLSVASPLFLRIVSPSPI